MKIATYEYAGEVSYGFVGDDSIVDFRELGLSPTNVVEFIESAETISESTIRFVDTRIPLDEVSLLPPCSPRKIVCAGVNFRTHREETGNDPERPEHPTIFSRFADSHVGHEHSLRRPVETERFDYEGELAVIIGTTAWQVAADDAHEFIYGYSIYNDGSVRDWQRHSRQWIPGKNFLASGAFGPWIVTADELPNLGKSRLQTRVNGQMRQEALIEDMVFSIGELIEYVTTFTPLHPGDVLVAGTPGGVGAYMDPPGLLVDGDVVEVEIEGIGTLRNTVRQAQ